MGKMTLCVAAAPLSWNGREFEAKSKAYLSLGEISLEKEIETNFQSQTSVTANWRYENGEIYIHAVSIQKCDKQKEIADFLTKKYGFEVCFD